MTYAINGSAASIAPVTVRWEQDVRGTDHLGAPVYSGYHQISMTFDPSPPASAAQWLTNAQGGSVNLTTLNRWSTSFTTLSGVYMRIDGATTIESIVANGFSITILRAIAP